jgi:hypothetical protein
MRYGRKVANSSAKERKAESGNQGIIGPFYKEATKITKKAKGRRIRSQKAADRGTSLRQTMAGRLVPYQDETKTRARRGERTGCNIVTSQCLQGYCPVFRV